MWWLSYWVVVQRQKVLTCSHVYLCLWLVAVACNAWRSDCSHLYAPQPSLHIQLRQSTPVLQWLHRRYTHLALHFNGKQLVVHKQSNVGHDALCSKGATYGFEVYQFSSTPFAVLATGIYVQDAEFAHTFSSVTCIYTRLLCAARTQIAFTVATRLSKLQHWYAHWGSTAGKMTQVPHSVAFVRGSQSDIIEQMADLFTLPKLAGSSLQCSHGWLHCQAMFLRLRKPEKIWLLATVEHKNEVGATSDALCTSCFWQPHLFVTWRPLNTCTTFISGLKQEAPFFCCQQTNRTIVLVQLRVVHKQKPCLVLTLQSTCNEKSCFVWCAMATLLQLLFQRLSHLYILLMFTNTELRRNNGLHSWFSNTHTQPSDEKCLNLSRNFRKYSMSAMHFCLWRTHTVDDDIFSAYRSA